VVHEVFYRLLTSREVRAGFRGGSLAAWLTTVARNQAIDHARRFGREETVAPEVAARLAERATEGPEGIEDGIDARRLLERFRRECVPARWDRVFVARFVDQLSQREAAARLEIRRTTLAYQELRIRRLLERFLLRGGVS
jgi:RNA polymerase sigma-70 factor (ECF subfamily)